VKIAVCIKRVPDMEMRFKIAPDGKSIDETGVKYDISDFDMYALEAALQLKEKAGSGEVVAISLGPDAVQETIRKALSMGVDRGVHLKVAAMPMDGFAIAQALAAELKDGAYDMILFGRMAVDSANGTVGPMTAELLGLPCATAVTKVEVAGTAGSADRNVEGGVEALEFALPAVVTIDEGSYKPRFIALKGIMAAKKKPLESKPAQLGEPRLAVAKLDNPPERPAGRIIGEGAAAVPELIRVLHTEAKVL
jgi:electron transfer flavoprotein beta subunit